MNQEKEEKLKSKGYEIGDVKDFLNLTGEEMKQINEKILKEKEKNYDQNR